MGFLVNKLLRSVTVVVVVLSFLHFQSTLLFQNVHVRYVWLCVIYVADNTSFVTSNLAVFFCNYRTVSQSSAHRLDAFCHCLFASGCFKNTYYTIATLSVLIALSLLLRPRRHSSQPAPRPHDGQINTNAALILLASRGVSHWKRCFPAIGWSSRRSSCVCCCRCHLPTAKVWNAHRGKCARIDRLWFSVSCFITAHPLLKCPVAFL